MNALAMMVDTTGPWAIHMVCVAVSAAILARRRRRMAAAFALSFLAGSAIAFGLGAVLPGGWFYWSEFFWEPVFRRTPVSLGGEDTMGLLMAWLLPLATSASVLAVLRTFRAAAIEQGRGSK